MNKRVKKSVSILPCLWKEAEERARRGDCSTSRVVERALRLAFDGIPGDESRHHRRRAASV